MSYRFRVKESIPRGIRRIAREQNNASLLALSQGTDIHQAVHQARQRLKCLRSLLHLIRHGLEASVFKAHDKGYRNIGRQLASARDAKVLLETLAKLENRPEICIKKINTNPIRIWYLINAEMLNYRLTKPSLKAFDMNCKTGKNSFRQCH